MSQDTELDNSQTVHEPSNSETGQDPETTDSDETVEGATPEENGNQEGQPAEETKGDGNSQLYARAKKAESELKKERAKSASYEQQDKVEEKFPEQDPYELAKTVQALKDYSPEEIDVIKRQAEAQGISPSEATQNEEVQAIIEKKREKKQVEESNPAPTNRQQPAEEDFSQWTPQTVEEKFQEGTEEAQKQIDQYYKWLKSGGGK